VAREKKTTPATTQLTQTSADDTGKARAASWSETHPNIHYTRTFTTCTVLYQPAEDRNDLEVMAGT